MNLLWMFVADGNNEGDKELRTSDLLNKTPVVVAIHNTAGLAALHDGHQHQKRV